MPQPYASAAGLAPIADAVTRLRRAVQTIDPTGYNESMRKLIVQYAKDLTAGRLASGFEHSYRVYRLAREVGEGESYDDDVLHAASFLHNVETPAIRLSESAQKAELILAETGFQPEKIPRVIVAILNHRPGGNPTTMEGKLLYDANLLDTMGAIGFARLAIGAFFWHHYKSMAEVLDLVQQRLGFADTFHFDRAREMAEPKVAFLRDAVTVFEQEMKL